MSHTLLTPILSNSSHHKELTPYEQGLIVGRSSEGASTAEIQKEFSVSELTIRWMISKAPQLNHSVSKPQSDHLKSCSICKQQHIIHMTQVKLEIIYQDLIEMTEINCLKLTVYWIVKKYKLINWLIKKCSLLQKKNAVKRLVWVKEWKN